VALQRTELGFQCPDAPVELALTDEVREVGTQVGIGEAPEVALAAKTWPLRKDREGEDLRVRERYRPTRTAPRFRAVLSPPFLDEHVQGDEQAFEVHGAPPFGRVIPGGGASVWG
jgi:hypothetical protein